jgi:alpha-amylase/alpha-mannosidase (GH57 family)
LSTAPARFVCVHGHFYQPPRENPWLEAVEVEDSARPYHDWNARITAECYAPNGASRVLDAERRILRIRNNYRRMSFNIGPTLAAWLARGAPPAYARIVEADGQSAADRGGHGNAIAQVYNHMILPLATRRDKVTQVRWGIADFRHRFDREPAGMWLPETAVDTETLEVLAEHGIAFTILAPHQAARVRPAGGGEWTDVSGGRIDPRRAYACPLPSGRRIVLFFYDGTIAHGVAFEGLLNNGDALAGRLLGAFAADDPRPQLVHIATDGESYGHHHPFGEMALAYAFGVIEGRPSVRLTNYAQMLAAHPPEWDVQIAEPTSWSCAHGVERWRSNCGCRTGNPNWSQEWRRPLRETLDWLRDRLGAVFEAHGPRYLRDPWAARDAYIEVVLDRSLMSVESFLDVHGRPEIHGEDRVNALRLLEMQRHAMLMFTSCGWFFDELSGIETVQVIKYAARALQLAEEFGERLEDEFVKRLGAAKSNLRQWRDGGTVYRRGVRPAFVTLPRVVAHYGISSLFEDYSDLEEVFCFTVRRRDVRREAAGGHALTIGLVTVTSQITTESSTAAYAVLHLGGHDIQCGVRAGVTEEWYEAMKEGVTGALTSHGASAAVRMLDAQFGGSLFGLRDLFTEERRKILGLLMEERLGRYEGMYDALYEESRPLITFMRDSDVPIPAAIRMAAEASLIRRMTAELGEAGSEPLSDRAFELAAEMVAFDLPAHWPDASPLLRRAIEARAEGLLRQPLGPDLDQVHRLLDLAEALGVAPNLWQTQNTYNAAALEHRDDLRATDDASDRVALFWKLGERLHFNLDALRNPEP